MKNSFNFLWNIGNDATTQYYFASVRDNPRTAITASGGGGEINARSGSPLTADRWYSLTSVIDGAAGRISFYVDGVQVGLHAEQPHPRRHHEPEPQRHRARTRGPTRCTRARCRRSACTTALSRHPRSRDVSDADAVIHAAAHQQAAQAVLDRVGAVTHRRADRHPAELRRARVVDLVDTRRSAWRPTESPSRPTSRHPAHPPSPPR